MRKATSAKRQTGEMLEHYDFKGAVRGKYAAQFREGTNLILLDPDVAEVFPDSPAVNQALRSLAGIIKSARTNAVKRRKKA